MSRIVASRDRILHCGRHPKLTFNLQRNSSFKPYRSLKYKCAKSLYLWWWTKYIGVIIPSVVPNQLVREYFEQLLLEASFLYTCSSSCIDAASGRPSATRAIIVSKIMARRRQYCQPWLSSSVNFQNFVYLRYQLRTGWSGRNQVGGALVK